MADEQFYTILTNVGKAKVANAALLSSNVILKTLKVGDGNGAYYNPTEEQKDLKNVVYTCNVGSVSIDKDNTNWIVAETIIPGSVGGFTIREVGLFDTEGDMIAIGKYPETYKPVVANGASKDLNVRTIFEVSNAASVNLSINPSIIIATKEDIENLQKQVTKNTEDLTGKANTKHTHSKTDITDFPSAIKNPNALTISLNGTSQGPYDGSTAKNIDITPKSIGTYSNDQITELIYTSNKYNYIINGSFRIDNRYNHITTANGSEYFCDRWYMWTTKTPTMKCDNGLFWNCGGNDNLIQMIEVDEKVSDYKMTLSFSIHGEKGTSISYSIGDSTAITEGGTVLTGGSHICNGEWENIILEVPKHSYSAYCRLAIACNESGKTILLSNMKLELGEYTPYTERPIELEQLLCRRYYLPITLRYRATMYTTNYLLFCIAENMRIAPSIRGNLLVQRMNSGGAGTYTYTTSKTLYGVTVCATLENHSQTDGILVASDNYVGLDSEIY